MGAGEKNDLGENIFEFCSARREIGPDGTYISNMGRILGFDRFKPVQFISQEHVSSALTEHVLKRPRFGFRCGTEHVSSALTLT